jgi:hypothetical protein
MPWTWCAKRGAGEGRRRDALLHGRGLALAEGQGRRPRSSRWSATVRALGLETCATLGMLTPTRRSELKDAGLDYYNHNLDTSPEFYGEIITHAHLPGSPRHADAVRDAGMKTCCGGIVGMGETRATAPACCRRWRTCRTIRRAVPINQLVQVPGTPLADAPTDPLDFVRTIAVARIAMPASVVRLSAGREGMSEELQALCFLAGANSIFYGEKLLTTGNPDVERDRALLRAARHPARDAGRGACAAVLRRSPPPSQISNRRRCDGSGRHGDAGRRRVRAARRSSRRQLLQQRLSRPRAAPGADRGDAGQRAHLRARAPALRTSSPVTAPSMKRSSANSRSSPAASARCCSPPATWRTSAWSARWRNAAISCSEDRLNHASLIDAGLLARTRSCSATHMAMRTRRRQRS